MLRRFDTGSPTIGKLYSSWFELGEHLKTVPSDCKATATEKHAERWAYGHAGIAAAAYVLDPEFHAHEQSTNVEVMEGFMDTLEKIAILVEVRRLDAASDDLKKQWKARAELITADPSKLRCDSSPPIYRRWPTQSRTSYSPIWSTTCARTARIWFRSRSASTSSCSTRCCSLRF